MGTPKLFILSDQMRGASFSLSQEKYTVGRADDCDICISAPTVSGHHCTLVKLDDGSYAIEDLGSTNGSKVNDQLLEPGNAVKLKNGDIFQIGNVEILFDDIEGAREESRTVSVIDLDDVDTGEINKTTMRNLGSRLGSKRGTTLRPNQKHGKIMNIIVILLAILVLVLLGIVIFK
jgi:pSer/pThr/pTyr-binding forkhead associated (FHA) protein